MAKGIIDDRAAARYAVDGYVVVPGLLDQEETALLGRAARADRVLDEHAFGRSDGEGGTVRLSLWNHPTETIYGMIAPSVEMPRKPGEWESVDATLVGRTVTVVRDGTTVIDHQEIPGITGGALDANEAEPGPFYIQGDHTGGMKYRNITIAVAKR